MFGMLIAYDSAGTVLATLPYLVVYDQAGEPLGMVDFAAHEAAGGEMAPDVWEVPGAKGSKVWPEWLGRPAFDFRVELEGEPGRKRIAALIHKASGHRRERAAVDAAIADRIERAKGEPDAESSGPTADIRDLVGGPDRPLRLDAEGRSLPWRAAPTLKHLLRPHGRALGAAE